MNDLNIEIERRLNDPLWERRMAKSVTERVKLEKKQHWSKIAAAVGFAFLVGSFGYMSMFSAENSYIASVFQPNQVEVKYDLPIEWQGIEKFPIEEDEEISLFLSMAY
ncbi:MAG: hypothetical protein H3C43_10830 [Leptonema sp. (in: Bacteria)]|nr:hypothetical protein [Leptonema sp. (in: bacteria)]